MVAEGEGTCRAWGEVSDSEKFFAKLPRVTEISEVKEKPLGWHHLVAKLELLGGGRKGESVHSVRVRNRRKFGVAVMRAGRDINERCDVTTMTS